MTRAELARVAGFHKSTVTGVFRYANTYPLALSLIGSGAVDVDAVVTHRLPVERAEEALTLGRTVPDSLKAVVRIDHG